MTSKQKITISRFSEINASIWNRFVDRCDEAWVHHAAEFVIASSYCYSFGIFLEDRLEGICAMGRERRRYGAYFSGPGVALSKRAQIPEVYDTILFYLRELARRTRTEAVEFTLPAMAPANHSRAYGDCNLSTLKFSPGIRWRKAWEHLPAYMSVVDLSRDSSEILRGFHKGQKANVRRCQKLGVASRAISGERCSDEEWVAFKEIHEITYARSGGATFSAQRIDGLREMVRLGTLILFNGYSEAECVASMLVAVGKKGAFYYAGGARDEARKNGVMAYMQFEIMRWLKEAEFRYYCVGFTVPMLTGSAGGGIGDFKKRLGGEQWPMLAGDLVVSRARFLLRHFSYDLLRRIREGLLNLRGIDT